MQNLKETASVALLSGGAAYLGSMYLLPNTTQSTGFFGSSSNYNVSPNLVAAGAVAGASVIGSEASDYILPMVSQNSMLSSYSGSLLKPALCGAGSLLTFKLGGSYNPDIQNMSTISQFGLGAASNLVGQYSYDKFISPTLKL